MSNNVVWEGYVSPQPEEINHDHVSKMEKHLGVLFPEDYKELIIKQQGKMPYPETISSSELFKSTFGPLYSMDFSLDNLNGILYKWNKWKDYYGDRVIPIAGTGGGACFFAYVYNGDNLPSIYFIDVEEEELLYVSKSITDLINNLS